MINCENARDYSKPTCTVMDHFSHEDVDLVVVFGRKDDAKPHLKKKKHELSKTFSCYLISPSVILVEGS